MSADDESPMPRPEPGRAWSSAPSSREVRECQACGLPQGTPWGTSEGTAWLCRPCATLHGLGCP